MKLSVRKIVVYTVAVGVLGCVLAAWYVDARQTKIVSQLVTEEAALRGELVALLTMNPSEVANITTGGVLKDCASRADYSDYLARLNTLTGNALVEAKNLHQQCSYYKSAIRAHKAVLLDEKVTRYISISALLETIDASKTTEERHESEWLSVVEKEQEIAQLLAEQSALQLGIINALIAGDSATVNTLVLQAQDVNDLLEVVSVQQQADMQTIVSI